MHFGGIRWPSPRHPALPASPRPPPAVERLWGAGLLLHCTACCTGDCPSSPSACPPAPLLASCTVLHCVFALFSDNLLSAPLSSYLKLIGPIALLGLFCSTSLPCSCVFDKSSIPVLPSALFPSTLWSLLLCFACVLLPYY
jgi:hypothetical protein